MCNEQVHKSRNQNHNQGTAWKPPWEWTLVLLHPGAQVPITRFNSSKGNTMCHKIISTPLQSPTRGRYINPALSPSSSRGRYINPALPQSCTEGNSSHHRNKGNHEVAHDDISNHEDIGHHKVVLARLQNIKEYASKGTEPRSPSRRHPHHRREDSEPTRQT